jgi:glycosyltransferase involved in cell wall biosynthesis
MKIALIHSSLPTFVRADRDLLRRDHQVHSIDFRWNTPSIVATLRAVQVCDLLFAWFAGQHSVLATMWAKALNKPIVVAAADYDLADERWFRYGSMRGGVRARMNNFIFRAAHLVLVPSAFSRDLALRNTVLKGMPDKLRMVPLGFEWTPLPCAAKSRALITVGGVSPENWVRKGLREFVALSRRMDVTCYLVGASSSQQFMDRVVKDSPPNLKVTGYLPDAKLAQLLGATGVYAQLSYMEGFGASLAEAMLAGCVPVVTRQGSLPEVVGDCGYFVNYGDEEGAYHAALAALEEPRLGMRARERVIDCFPLQRRRQHIASALAEVTWRPRGRVKRSTQGDLAVANPGK